MAAKIHAVGYLSLALLLFTVKLTAQDASQDIKAWYPLEPGDTWTYQHESLEGDMANPDFERWITEESVVNVLPVQFGATLVTKSIKVVSDFQSAGFFPGNDYQARREPYLSHILIRQNCFYLLDGYDAGGADTIQVSDTEDVSALDDANQIRPVYWEALLRGDVSADFCFPMANGMTWGKVPSTSPALEYVWHVTGFNADPFGPQGGDTYRLQSRPGGGEVIDRWFEKGVGVVQEDEEHHGTYDESRRLLLSSTIGGKAQTYQLTPAKTVPVSASDCGGIILGQDFGPRWQHYARADGTPFRDVAECVDYSSQRR